jgi:hypothetical protein
MVRSGLLVMVLLLAAVGQVNADPVLYSNGPGGFSGGGLLLGSGYSGSDSFIIQADPSNPSNPIVTGVQAVLWSDGSPTSVQWSIGTTPNSSNRGSGTATLTNTLLSTNTSLAFGTVGIYSSTFSLNQPLVSGTYYLTLQNATSSGGAVFWDVNSGGSLAFDNAFSPVPSEAFEILGTQTAPEPASIILLGIGIAGCAGYGLRSRAKNQK